MHWGVLSTSLPRSRHVEVQLCIHFFKEFVLSKVFFLDGVRALAPPYALPLSLEHQDPDV